MRYFMIYAAASVFAARQTPPPAPEKLSEATLRSYLFGRWFRETTREFAYYQLQIDYRADGTVATLEFDYAYDPDGTPRLFRHECAGRWTIVGTKLVHHWTPRSRQDTPLDLRECEILRATPSEMRLRDTEMDYLVLLYRKPRLAG